MAKILAKILDIIFGSIMKYCSNILCSIFPKPNSDPIDKQVRNFSDNLIKFRSIELEQGGKSSSIKIQAPSPVLPDRPDLVG